MTAENSSYEQSTRNKEITQLGKPLDVCSSVIIFQDYYQTEGALEASALFIE